MPRTYNFAPEISVERARELRQRQTRAEGVLWQALRRKPWGIKFRRQHPVGPFILDFYCADAKLGIELDGGYHDEALQKENDTSRAAAILQRRGLDIVLFSNDEVLADLPDVLEAIRREVTARRPSP